MKKVYSVAKGNINTYEIIKETDCFYNIESGTYKDRISKQGLSLPDSSGGRTKVTTDILEAVNAAQEQINKINRHYLKIEAELIESEKSLKEFIENNTSKIIIN